MRGIEGALTIMRRVEDKKGGFVSEELRKLWNEIDSAAERKLAATLAFTATRKMGLWRHLLTRFCKRPVTALRPETASALRLGIAGVMELERFGKGSLISALVQRVKEADAARGGNDAPLVNAVLRAVLREGPAYVASLLSSHAFRDVALARGMPGWAAAKFVSELGKAGATEAVRLLDTPALLSARLAPGTDAAAYIAGTEDASAGYCETSVRFSSTPLPTLLPGYAEGLITPQTESSVWAASAFAAHIKGGFALDMCCGRGVKAGQLLSLRPDLRLECWELSPRRAEAARRELARIGASDRAVIREGDARELEPQEPPSAILLDAPCSGSGTWRRHPEAKWRLTPEKLAAASALQAELFSRAADILAPGGVIMYCTCSMFRAENEDAAGSVLSRRTDLAEIQIRGASPAPVRRGRPYGAALWPENPWTDGFYAAIFKKKG